MKGDMAEAWSVLAHLLQSCLCLRTGGHAIFGQE
jgi:hypothetical protein